jgi:zinc transport system substrate-binding protein
MKKKILLISFLLVLILFSALLFSLLEKEQKKTSDSITVTTSVYPLSEFVQAIGKEKLEATSIIPPGIEPHEFTPTPRDRIRIEKSQLFVFVGAGFEPWAERMLPDLNMTATLEASQGLSLFPATTEEKTDENRLFDPHILADPVLVLGMVDNITEKLSEIDPANAPFYGQNASLYREKIEELHSLFNTGLAACERRDFVTSHAAFAYLARRYDLTQIPIAGMSEEDPSPAKLAEIVQLIKQRNIKYVFMENLTGNPKLVETLTKETGAEILVLYPPEDTTNEDAVKRENYVSHMMANLQNLRLALGCE